jgi:hypothetical protein
MTRPMRRRHGGGGEGRGGVFFKKYETQSDGSREMCAGFERICTVKKVSILKSVGEIVNFRWWIICPVSI